MVDYLKRVIYIKRELYKRVNIFVRMRLSPLTHLFFENKQLQQIKFYIFYYFLKKLFFIWPECKFIIYLITSQKIHIEL